MPRYRSDYDAAKALGRLWTPYSIQGNLFAWFDADDPTTFSTSTFSGTSYVEQWSDKGPKARHVVPAASNTKPVYNTVAFNNKPALVYGAEADDRLVNTSIGGSAGELVQCFAVVRRDGVGSDTDGWGRIISFAQATLNDSPDGIIPIGYNSNLAELIGGPYTSGSVAVGVGEFNIISSISTTSSWSMYKNGTQSTPQTYTYPSATMTRMAIGGHMYPSTTLDCMYGAISEVIIVSGSMSDRVRMLIEGYLAHKWGLVDRLIGSHSYKNRPPLLGG